MEGRIKRKKVSKKKVSIFHTYPSLVRTLVGRYLSSDFRSYFALSVVTKSLWHEYCHYDEAVRFMRYAYPKPSRSSLILASGLSLCMQWLWYQDCKLNARHKIAFKYASVGADHGLLDIIQMVAPFMPTAEEESLFTEMVDAMARAKHDDALVEFVTHPPWLIAYSKRTRICLYFSAIKYVTHLPKFYALMQTIILPNDLYPDDPEQRMITLLAVAATGDLESFGFFWNQLPKEETTRKRYMGILVNNLFMRYGGGPTLDTMPLLVYLFFKPFANHSEDPNRLVFTFGWFTFVFEKKPTDLEDEVLCEMTRITPEEHEVVHLVLPTRAFTF